MKKTKFKVWGRALSLVLALVLAFSLVACDLGGGDKSTVPGKPKDLAATVQSTQVKLSWTAADNGGEAITKYQFTYAVKGSDTADDWKSTQSHTSHTITGLTLGTEYTFKVRAVNSVGAGAAAEITEKVGEVDTSPKPLSEANKKIIKDSLDALKASTNFSIDIETTTQNTGAAAETESYGVEVTVEDGFRARNGSKYYLLADDQLWYSIKTNDEGTEAFETAAAARASFDIEIANVYGLFGLVAALGSVTHKLVTDGTTQTFQLFCDITNGELKNIHTYDLVIKDGKPHSYKLEIEMTQSNGGATVGNATITAEFDYATTSITAPEDWQDEVFGDGGAATTLTQLDFAIKRAINEPETWENSDEEKLFKLSIYAVYAKYFKYTDKGKFVFDEAYLDNTAAFDEMVDAMIIDTIYENSGANLYSENLLGQLTENDWFDLSGYEQVLTMLSVFSDAQLRAMLLGMIKGNSTDPIVNIVAGLLGDNLDFLINMAFGGPLTTERQTNLLTAELDSSYISVHYGRITEYATNGGSNKVKPVYNTDLPVTPEGTLSTTERNALNAAIAQFENSTTWTVEIYETTEKGGETEVIDVVYARSGSGTSFKGSAAGIIDDSYMSNYLITDGDGLFHSVSYQGDSQETATLSGHKVLMNAAEAEELFSHYLDIVSVRLRLEEDAAITTTFESYANEVKGGKSHSTFLYEGEHADVYYLYEYTREIVTVDGKVASMEIIITVTNKITNAVVYVTTTTLTFSTTATITPPENWEDDIADEDEPPTVAHLIAALNYAIDNPAAWNSNAEKLFTLKNYAEFAPYYMYVADIENVSYFMFDGTTLDDPTALGIMWNAYLAGYLYNMGLDLYSEGLYTKASHALLAMGYPYSAMVAMLTQSDSAAADAENRVKILSTVNSFLFSGTNDTTKKATIIDYLETSAIMISDGKLFAFIMGSTPVLITYND